MSVNDHPLLVENKTCWQIARADRLSIIIDAADFFRAAKQAMLKARHSITLIGWDFDARIELEPEGQTLVGPNRIGKFLNWVAKKRPDLDVRILKWDIGMLRSLGRGETPFFMLNWMTGRNVRLKLDGAHPAMAAHHMKLLVIDDALAFCGGIDMTTGRWDTREHQENRPGRHTPRGNALGPWHDATSCVSGPAAKSLADLARRRWSRATDEEIEELATDSDPWPDHLTADFRDLGVGIARTEPEYREFKRVCEIEAATLAIIRSAEHTLYIESQYFASRKIAQAMADRLAEADGPEIVIINPDTADGWLEAKTMDSARIRMMHLVSEADVHDRFRIYYPVNDAGSPIYVHAKIMIADDRVLKIGSANLNNRSMGYDTECDLVIEARDEDEATRHSIRAKRDGLLAEHLGQSVEQVSATILDCGGSLIHAIEELNTRDRRLVPLPSRPLTESDEAFAESDVADPERATRLKDKMPRLLQWVWNRMT